MLKYRLFFVFSITVLAVLSITGVKAQFIVQAKATGNTFSTASSFTTATPTPTITLTPTPTTTITPTPTGNPHKRCEISLFPFFIGNGTFIHFSIFNCFGFRRFKYELFYDTDTIQQGIFGEDGLFGSDNNIFTSKPITLGACSAGGICVYDKNPRHFQLKINFFSNDSDTSSFSESANYD